MEPLPKSKATLLELDNKKKLQKAIEEHEAQVAIIEGFILDGSQWSGLGGKIDIQYESLLPVSS